MVLVFSRGITHFYGITFAMTFDFYRISNTNLETSKEYLQKGISSATLLVFFLEQTTDREIGLRLSRAAIPCPLNWARTSP